MPRESNFHNSNDNFKKSLKIALKKRLLLNGMKDQLFPYSQLWQFAFEIFSKIGCPEAQARQATDVLLSADLRGVDTTNADAAARLSRPKSAARDGRDHATRTEGWQAGDLWRWLDRDCRDGQGNRHRVIQAARDSAHGQVIRSSRDASANRQGQCGADRGVDDQFSRHLIRTSADHFTLERQINVGKETVFRDHGHEGLN